MCLENGVCDNLPENPAATMIFFHLGCLSMIGLSSGVF